MEKAIFTNMHAPLRRPTRAQLSARFGRVLSFLYRFDLTVSCSQNSETIRCMVRQTDQTRSVAGETLTVLDQQSGC